MEYRALGRTGLKVAPFCLGGNVFGFPCDEAASNAVLDTYDTWGGNFIDTANTYVRFAPGKVGGESEAILGKWMAERKNRHRVIIATKVGSRMGDGPNEAGSSRAHIMSSVEGSLRRLRTDYIDLYQLHRDDRSTPLDETLAALDDLVRQGKVRYLGASNVVSWRLVEALWASDRNGRARIDCLQPGYNLLDRQPFESDLEAACHHFNLGVIAYSALGSGFLTGKYRRGDTLPETWRGNEIRRAAYFGEHGFAVLDALDEVAARHTATVAQVALSWIIHRPGLTAPIASATTPEQLHELLGAVDVRLDPEDLRLLDQVSA